MIYQREAQLLVGELVKKYGKEGNWQWRDGCLVKVESEVINEPGSGQ